jgi:hypothetical protein
VKQDDVGTTRIVGSIWRENEGDAACRAYVVRKAIHGRDLHFPTLFAGGIEVIVFAREICLSYIKEWFSQRRFGSLQFISYFNLSSNQR